MSTETRCTGKKSFEHTLHTNGAGIWSNTSKAVKTLYIVVTNYEEDFGELRVHFDTDTWNIYEDGLIYTDPRFLSELHAALYEDGYSAQGVDYSEQGMQGINYVSLDVGKNFIKSFYEEKN